MASLPEGAIILTLEEATTYFRQWSIKDRLAVLEAIKDVGVTQFYAPPSGGYVAGHGGGDYGMRDNAPVNGLVMHVGFLHLWPNLSELDGDERRPLSNYRGESWRPPGGTRTYSADIENSVCEACFIELPATGVCGYCG